MKSECINSYKLMGVVVIWILLYNIFLSTVFSHKSPVEADILNRKIIDFDYFMGNCCSMWPISHFIFFFILGLLYPHCDVPIMGTGILWEGMEEMVSIINNYQDTRHIVRDPVKGVQYRDSWWAGSFQDILFNAVGFYLGKLLVIVFGINIKIGGMFRNH